MCCLSLAHAMRTRIALEPSQRALFHRSAERLMDLATEFGLSLNNTLMRMEDHGERCHVAASLLLPDPEATLQLAMRLHDIETVAVPWIQDYAQTMRGDQRFLHETYREGGGTELQCHALTIGAANLVAKLRRCLWGNIESGWPNRPCQSTRPRRGLRCVIRMMNTCD